MLDLAALKQFAPKGDERVLAAIASQPPEVLRAGIADNIMRVQHWLAQDAHESMGFTRLEESGWYSARRLRQVFAKYFSPDEARAYAKQPQRILSRAYANRLGNGPESSGDGWRYRGRGIRMLTGRSNYRRYGAKLGIDLEGDPDRAADPDVAVRIAALYWDELGLNQYADQDDLLAVSRGINLGNPHSRATPNGMKDRRYWLKRDKRRIKPAAPAPALPARREGGPSMRWMEEAWAQLGEEEIAGPKHNPEIVAYFADSKNAGIQNDEVAWCAAFVGAVLERSGIESTRSPMARSYESFGQPVPVDSPRYGCLAVLKRTNDPRFGHVGFVTGWTDKTVKLLGGNQNDAVSIAGYDRERVVALRWPEPAKTPTQVAQAGSRIAQRAKKQQVNAGVSVGAGTSAAAAGAATQGTPAATPPTPEPATPDLSGLQEIAEQVDMLHRAVDVIINFAHFTFDKWHWIGEALAVYFGGRVIYDAVLVRLFRAEDENTGAHVGQKASPPPDGEPAAFEQREV